MGRSVDQEPPSSEVQRLDETGESLSPKSGPRQLPNISLEMAKAQIGNALRRTIQGDSLKEYGDPSHVRRVCNGDISEPLARAWAHRRRELVQALAEESGLFDVHMSISERKKVG
jgi:hypothetical protein